MRKVVMLDISRLGRGRFAATLSLNISTTPSRSDPENTQHSTGIWAVYSMTTLNFYRFEKPLSIICQIATSNPRIGLQHDRALKK